MKLSLDVIHISSIQFRVLEWAALIQCPQSTEGALACYGSMTKAAPSRPTNFSTHP